MAAKSCSMSALLQVNPAVQPINVTDPQYHFTSTVAHLTDIEEISLYIEQTKYIYIHIRRYTNNYLQRPNLGRNPE
jgi:hypothetical protein